MSIDPVSILYKSIAGRYRPVRVADGPITARCRFIKNAGWGYRPGGAGTNKISGPSYSKLTVSLVNVSLKL